MSPSDIKPGMSFSMRDISSYWVEVEGVDGEYALCRYFTCFSGGRERVRLSYLANEEVFERIK